jgi:hypothetical protein
VPACVEVPALPVAALLLEGGERSRFLSSITWAPTCDAVGSSVEQT